MCFSPIASAALATLLTVIGTITLRTKKVSSSRMFAAIPLIFALQQWTEFGVWITINNQNYTYLHTKLVSLFLFFALVLWPTWMPLTCQKLMPYYPYNPFMLFLAFTIWPSWMPPGIVDYPYERLRARWITGLCVLGALFSIGALIYLIFVPSSITILDGNLVYNLTINPTGAALFKEPFFTILYGFITVTPFFLIPDYRHRILGGLLLATLILTNTFFNASLISVWCFFAALLSIGVLVIQKTDRS